ncbi:MAG: FGGY family carbohydrate kinase, partial [Maribacter sp.]|nr:FGGY family carbohydrate kinase [Maribacter sp.]
MYAIGYDIGSSSIKAALVKSSSGRKLSVVTEPKVEMGMIAIENGWAEQDPLDWWKYVCTATKRLLEQNNIDPKEITGIGISYQMHGLV